MNTWTCPKCPYVLTLDGQDGQDTMADHISLYHPEHWAWVKFIAAMSRD